MSLTNPTVNEIISACDCALENANEHSTDAYGVWSSVASFVPTTQRKAAARALADHLASDWETFLPNVT